MNTQEKIQLAERFQLLAREYLTSDDLPILVGTLKKKGGLIGFEPAEIGHPVFEFKGRYILYLKSLVPDKQTKEHVLVTVPYELATLGPQVEFSNPETNKKYAKDTSGDSGSESQEIT